MLENIEATHQLPSRLLLKGSVLPSALSATGFEATIMNVASHRPYLLKNLWVVKLKFYQFI